MPELSRLKTVVGFLEGLSKWTAYVTAIVIAVGYLVSLFRWGQKGPFLFIRSHVELLWSVAVTASILLLWIWAARLRGRFALGFADDFKRDLRLKWDFVGSWEVTPDRTLVVTSSEQAGLTKTGAQWENYTLTFEAKIVKNCLGVIVRAQDLDNYYMLQIKKNGIRPHRRVAVPTIQPGVQGKSGPGESVPLPVAYTTGWQIFDDLAVELGKQLDEWFSARVSVRGEALDMYVNDDLVWQHGSFLKIATGKIGFRNWGPERALVRKVRVRLDT